MKTAHTARVTATSVLLAGVVAGCGATDCTDIGATSALTVKVGGFPRALDTASVGPEVVDVQVCLASTCVSSSFDGAQLTVTPAETARP